MREDHRERAALDRAAENERAAQVARWRSDFPILARSVNGRPLVYLDNGATSQKPRCVIEAEARYYEYANANVHRGVHRLSQEATDAYEAARDTVQAFLNARQREEIVFVRGTTEAINLVAQSFGTRFGAGDELLVTGMEHHSNIVPWQLACARSGATLKVVPVDDRGELDLDAFESLISSRTRLVALTHVSNALGTINPVARLVALTHARGVPVLVDGAQAVPHLPVDVQALDCDFYAFSGHKLYGPTGIGVLYGRRSLLEDMPPWQGGGDMIRQVSFERTTYNDLPYKFEAGTPNIAGAIALGEAIRYVQSIGFDAIAAHERALLRDASARAEAFRGLRPIGTARDKAAILSFVLADVHAHDVGSILDHEGVAVRTGHHCAMPLMERFGVAATVRASFGLYNTHEEVAALFAALRKVREVFGDA